MAKMNVTYLNRVWSVDIPDKCPICHHLIVITETPAIGTFEKFAEIVFRCPNPDCRRLFVGYFELDENSTAVLTRFLPNEPSPEEISIIIKEISPDFAEIYKQAKEAQASGLTQVSGPGYRKAFEFLIKDYAKSKTQDKATRNSIETTFAGTVVNKYINDIRVQAVAKRALWLGNDEAHYLRKWTTLNVEDLIALIRLTIHWIEIEHLSAKYVDGMIEGTAGNSSKSKN
jgi:hypothetical protein